MNWRKSSASGTNGENCVEVAALPDSLIAIRDSKAPDAGHVEITRRIFGRLASKIKDDSPINE